MVPADCYEPSSTHTVEQFSFLLFLEVIVVKIPSIISSRRENPENQSYLSKKKAKRLFHLFHKCHSTKAINIPSIHTSINRTNQTQVSWSSGDRGVFASLVARVQLVPWSLFFCVLFFSFSPSYSCQNTIILSDRENTQNQSYLTNKTKEASPTYSTRSTA